MSRRVKQLRYRVIQLSEASRLLDDAEPLHTSLNGFDIVADSRDLAATPATDYEDVADAHFALQPALDAWSATSELIDKCPLAFELIGHTYEQTGPADPSSTTVYAGSAHGTGAAFDAFAVARNKLPEPHAVITSESQVAAQLRSRLRKVVQGTESPVAVGYFVLTTLEEQYKGRKRAAQRLNISPDLLDQLGRISSTYDPVRGRKAHSKPGVISDDQLHWLKYACPAIIRRVLECEAGADTSDKLTKDDLPPLPS